MYVWEMAGLRWAHLGDIGQHAFRPDQKTELGAVDVLFVPVGGRTTVNAAEAAELVKEINPRSSFPCISARPAHRFFEFDPLGPFRRFLSG